MNRIKLFIAGAALLFAIGIGFLAMSVLEPDPVPVVQAPAAPAPEVPVIAQSDVLVAARELPTSTPLKETDLAWLQMPDSLISSTMIKKKTNPQGLQQSVGKITGQQISAGEPIRQDRLNVAAAAGVLASKLKSGMRAYTVSIDDKSSYAGFILPRDTVDVIAFSRSEAGGKGSQTIVRSAKIIAVDGATETINGTNSKARAATIEVYQHELEMLSRLERSGVQLMLTPIPQEDQTNSLEERTSFPSLIFQKRPL